MAGSLRGISCDRFFDPLARQAPQAAFHIDFRPPHSRDFIAAGAGQDEQLDQRAKRVAAANAAFVRADIIPASSSATATIC